VESTHVRSLFIKNKNKFPIPLFSRNFSGGKKLGADVWICGDASIFQTTTEHHEVRSNKATSVVSDTKTNLGIACLLSLPKRD
jgi:hypothetical protein